MAQIGPVAMITGRYPSTSMTFVDREVRGLRDLGCEVVSFTLRTEQPEQVQGAFQNLERSRVRSLMRDLCNPISTLKAGIACVVRPKQMLGALCLAVKTCPPGLWGMLRQAGLLVAALHFAVHLRRIGAVHIHNHLGDSSGTVALLASRLTGLPFSMTLHGPEVFDQANYWHLRRKIECAAFVACISAFARNQTARHTSQTNTYKLKIVRCGVEPERYGEPCPPPNANKLLFVGRLEPRKGVFTLIKSLKLLSQMQRHDVHLTIVGSGSELPDLETFVLSHGLAEVVQFVGAVDEDSVAKLLKYNDILVVPSLSEGLPVIIMEAFASCRPVIASAVDGIPELVLHGQSGLLVPPADPEALASAISKLLGDKDLCIRLAENGRRVVLREHDARVNAQDLLALMTSAIKPMGTSNAQG